MKLIAIDISGNHASEKEGSGTTGIAIWTPDLDYELAEVKASDYKTTEEYWNKIINEAINGFDHVIIEGYRLYNHRGMSASTQANSTLPTSQLLGALRHALWLDNTPYTIQYASEVKTRWSDEILIHNGYLEEGNLFKGKRTNDHRRDALRHLVHYMTYKME